MTFLRGVHERLLRRTLEDLANTFRGRRIDVPCGGARLRAVLESLRLDQRADRCGARLVLRDAEWDGLQFDRLSAVADAVALTAPPAMALSVSAVELDGVARLVPFAAWLDRTVPRWQFGVSPDGLLDVRRRGGRVRFLVEPVVESRKLTVELRAVGWRKRLLRLPAWLHLTRQQPLPELGNGIVLHEASRRGNVIDFRLTLPPRRAISIW